MIFMKVATKTKIIARQIVAGLLTKNKHEIVEESERLGFIRLMVRQCVLRIGQEKLALVRNQCKKD
jgi:hypothetical protein